MTGADIYPGYVECAIWASLDDDGEPLDRCDVRLSPEAMGTMQADCESFVDGAADLIRMSELDAAQVGHDFWLTRNGHGAGFWDRGLGDVGEALSESAAAFGSCDLYVGDDGEVYAA